LCCDYIYHQLSGRLEEQEEKRQALIQENASKFVPKEETLEEVLSEIEAKALRYEYEREHAEELKQQAKEQGMGVYRPPPEKFDVVAEKARATVEFNLRLQEKEKQRERLKKAEEEDALKEKVKAKEEMEMEERLAARLHKEWSPEGDEG
jgi:hypothetical protein